MSDPVSLAGTAVGIVSLGLSACQGLISYYNSYRDCPKEAKNMLQKIEGLKDALEVLEDVLHSHDSLQADTAAVKTAKRNIQACKSGLEQLDEIREKCQTTPIKSQAGQDFINRSLYPFRRGTIRAVLEHVEGLQSNLDTSIDVLQLSVSSQNSDRTTRLCTTTQQIVNGYTEIHTDVKNIDRVQQVMNQDILFIRQQLENKAVYPSQQDRPAFPDSTRLQPSVRDNHEALSRTMVSFLNNQEIPASMSRTRRQKCSCSSLPASSRAKKASFWNSSHKFGCPLYAYEEKSIFERRFKFNNFLSGTSIHFCLKSIRMAGGYTILPSLNFSPIVDEKRSPAFELIRKTGTVGFFEGSISPGLSRDVINQLQSIYEEGSASPRDTTPEGRNLLHNVLSSFWRAPESTIPHYCDLIKHLAQFGVPLNETSYVSGLLEGGALNMLLAGVSDLFDSASKSNQDQMVLLVSDLVSYGADLTQKLSKTTSLARILFHKSSVNQVVIRYCSSSYLHAIARRNILLEYHESYSSNLEKCIISRSEVALEKAISTPTSMEEPTDKQYLAEICIGWPPGLRIFLDAGYHLNKNKLLTHAIITQCYESVQILLNENVSAIDCAHVNTAQSIANPRIFKLIMLSLAERIKKLQSLAERHLPVHIQSQLHLPNQGVLDSHAIHVYSKLKAFGIHIDPYLEVSQSMVCVYDYIGHDIDAAKMLFEAGFQNLELGEEREDPYSNGLTTLMRLSHIRHPEPLWKVLETLLFLNSKGADPHRGRRGDGRTALHFLGLSLSSILIRHVTRELQIRRQIHSSDWDSVVPSKRLKAITDFLDQEWCSSNLNHRTRAYLETVFIDCHNDACLCACSAQGCLPSSLFFGHFVRWTGSSVNIQDIAEVIRFLGKRATGSVKTLNDTLAPTILRICIFEFLELTHTCCEKIDVPDSNSMYYEDERVMLLEDISRIRDEQRIMIEQVEELTTFFLAKYHEMDLNLPEFLLDYFWIEINKDSKAGDEEKMREYQLEIEQITGRRLGVVLDD